jgi:chromosome segregation ATPase
LPAAREKNLEEAAAEKTQLLTRREQLQSELQQQEEILRQLSDEKQILLAQLQEHREEIALSQEAREQLENDLNTQQQAYEQKLETAIRNNETLDDELANSKQQIEQLQAEYEQQEAVIQGLGEKLEANRSDLEAAEQNIIEELLLDRGMNWSIRSNWLQTLFSRSAKNRHN